MWRISRLRVRLKKSGSLCEALIKLYPGRVPPSVPVGGGYYHVRCCDFASLVISEFNTLPLVGRIAKDVD